MEEAKVYHLNVEEIEGFDDYIKDFEEQAEDFCKSSATSMAQSVFSEFTEDTQCGVFLDSEQTKAGYPIEFLFGIVVDDGKLMVSYYGFN